MTLPTISVTVPCYNYAQYLPACLDSLLRQEGVDLDVTIVDDASTDNTRTVAAAYAGTDPRVRIIRHEANQGHVRTFNDGIAVARGTYFTIVSADDVLTPGALKRAIDVMEANPRVGLVYGPHISVCEKGLCLFGMAAGSAPIARSVGPTRIYPGAEWKHSVCSTGRCFIIGSNAVVRTATQKAAGLYDPDLPHAGDCEMWLRLAHIADVAYVGVDQLLYRVHDKSLQRTVYAGFEFDLEARRKSFQGAFAKRAITADQLIAAEYAINRILATGNGGWWHREVIERLRHRKQRRIGVAA